MKHLYKVLISVLALVMLIGAFTSSVCATTDSSKQNSAYRQVLQNTVDTYGIFHAETTSQFEYSLGFIDARFLDLTGDGADEMCVFYVAPSAMSDGNGENNIYTKIYTYQDGSAREIFSNSSSIYLPVNFVAYNDGNKPYFIYGNSYYSDVLYCFKDGEIAAGGDFTEEEQQRITEIGHLLGGVSAEYEMKLSIWAEHFGITLQPYEKDIGHFYINTGTYSSEPAVECLSSLGVKLPQHVYIDSVPYIGTKKNCKMTADMAKAYADVIENFPMGAFDEKREAILVDQAGDGMPLLLIADYNFNIQSGVWYHLFTYENNTAKEFDLGGQISCSYSFGYYNDIPVFTIYDAGGTGESFSSETLIYKIQNATLELISTYESFNAYSYDGQTAYGDYQDLFVMGEAPLSKVIDAGWLQDGYILYMDVLNGEQKHFSSPAERSLWLDEWNNSLKVTNSMHVFYNFVGSDNRYAAINSLNAYADKYSRYSYPSVTEENEEELVKSIAEAVAKAVGGEITEIYKLADGVYYVLITVDGSEKGVVVKGSISGGKLKWNVTETHDTPVNESTLVTIVSGILSKPNITLDYDTIANAKTKDIINHITSSLDNMDGVTPNDAGKSVLSSYIESALSSISSVAVSGKDNRLTSPAKEIEALAKEATKAKQDIEKLLSDRNIKLNKSLTIIIRILWKDMDSNAPCQITLDKAVLDSLNGCALQILLGDAKHYIQISESNLIALIELLGTVTVQLSKESNGVYIINFLDNSGNVIDKMSLPVTIGLPANSSTSTIMVSYSGGSDNWGGQYDSVSNIISFDASFSGRYEVLENNIEITDISHLDDETNSAISFLVSKGYMNVENGAFLPDTSLNRYHFSTALVGMFFALDRSLTLNFPDVPVESPYYSYVASAAAQNIIVGYDDGMFHGDNEITTEQMLALAARTLINYKGYSLPENPSQYLNTYEDGSNVSDWAKQQVALAVREGLVDRGGELDPLGNVTREEAALILYRLFLLLHEVPAVALELPATDEPEETTSVNTDNTSEATEINSQNDNAKEEDDNDKPESSSSATLITVAVASAVTLAAIGGVSVFVFKKKK